MHIYSYKELYIYNVCEKYIKQAGKYNHGHFKADGTTHSIPTALALAFESLMLGRQSLGERERLQICEHFVERSH